MSSIAIVATASLARLLGVALRHLNAELSEPSLAQLATCKADLAIVEAKLYDAREGAGDVLGRATIPVLAVIRPPRLREMAARLRDGFEDTIVMPIECAEVIERVAVTLRRTTHRLPLLHAVVPIGRLRSEPAKGQCSLDGVPLPLTPLERRLLIVLASNAGRMVSREDLLDLAWAMDGKPASNLIESHVKELRRKLAVSDRPLQIETSRGRGYTISAEELGLLGTRPPRVSAAGAAPRLAPAPGAVVLPEGLARR